MATQRWDRVAAGPRVSQVVSGIVGGVTVSSGPGEVDELVTRSCSTARRLTGALWLS